MIFSIWSLSVLFSAMPWTPTSPVSIGCSLEVRHISPTVLLPSTGHAGSDVDKALFCTVFPHHVDERVWLSCPSVGTGKRKLGCMNWRLLSVRSVLPCRVYKENIKNGILHDEGLVMIVQTYQIPISRIYKCSLLNRKPTVVCICSVAKELCWRANPVWSRS